MHEMGGPSSCPDYGYAALGLHLTHGSKSCTQGTRSARIWALQCVHDGEDGEDGKGGGGGMEGGSQAWWLLGVILLSWGLPGWSWRPWECPGTRTCLTNGLCMHHAWTMGGIKALRLM